MTPSALTAAAAVYSNDARDTLPPVAMTTLLTKVATGALLSRDQQNLLPAIMQRCQGGAGAIKGMLPPGTPVAHKMGTLAEVVANDVGIITLPHSPLLCLTWEPTHAIVAEADRETHHE